MNVIDDDVGVAMHPHSIHASQKSFCVNITNCICYFYIKLYVEKYVSFEMHQYDIDSMLK